MKQRRLPASSGGIVQYHEEGGASLSVSPKQLIFITLIFVVLVLILKWTNLLGL